MKRLSQVVVLLLSLLLISCKQENYYCVDISAQPGDGGSVSMTPSTNPVLEGTQVSFKATPNGDYIFTGWSGSLSGTENPRTVTVTSDMAVTAIFVLRDYPLTLSVEGEGSIEEKVISTKTDYSSGTVVELTAVPAAGWSFDHWEGDLSGSDNPVQISVLSAKSVKAVFIKRHYAYNLKIVGPGVVNEFLVENTKASLEYGTRVLLKAFPDEGALFKGWSGDLSGTETEVIVDIDATKEIIAVFEAKAKRSSLNYPMPNLMQPWYKLKDSHCGFDFSDISYSSYRYLVVDYNRDGLLDVILADYDGYGSLDRSHPLRFFLGQSDGTLTPDENNDGRIQGMIHIRKMMYGDYNADGYPDICLLGHGYDMEPWGGEYPVILMSTPNGVYNDVRFTNYVSFYHGGSQGDFDNDGDLDLFIMGNFGHSALMINDGSGYFTVDESKVHPHLFEQLFNTELYDFDHDGYLDLICGGHDWGQDHEWPGGDAPYQNTPIVFWGNGKTFNTEDYVRLPVTNNDGFSLACDYYFKDLNNDGVDEIIVARTGDGLRTGGPAYYEGWSIQVLECTGRQFKDVSSQFFSDKNDSFNFDRELDGWIVWLDMREIEGKWYLIGCFDSPNYPCPVKLLEFTGGKFVRVDNEPGITKLTDGLFTYGDWTNASEWASMWNDPNISIVDYECQDSPYAGDQCIRVPNGWNQYTCIWFRYNHHFDFSSLLSDDYCLEFYLKNSDPTLQFHIKFEKFTDWYEQDIPVYFYEVHADNTRHDGTWEVVRIPLKSFNFWWPVNQNGYVWDKINRIEFITISEGGKEFFLDEIRVRKVLPED